jgi:hypothetical protein
MMGWAVFNLKSKRDPDSKRHTVFRIIYVFFGIFINADFAIGMGYRRKEHHAHGEPAIRD